MKTLRSHVAGRWHEAVEGFAPLHDPCSEEGIAQASSHGIDFEAALRYAREEGGPALRELTVADRGELLSATARALHEHRDELIELSLKNTGATRKDAKFDIDGGTFTLSHYASLGEAIGGRADFLDGKGIQLGRSARFWGQHLLLPMEGVAVHINAFNFPVWGFAEKAACALLAGMPVITKPATSSCMVAERCLEIIVEARVLPPGAFSMVCGSTGNLLDLLGAEDVLAFTGSATTALRLRSRDNLLQANTRVNLEADSLNATVLGEDVDPGSETFAAFLREGAREITQKTGQKCTATRRVLVPRDRIDEVESLLIEQLSATVVGNPREPSVTMGPLATQGQLEEAVTGVEMLCSAGRRVLGSGQRVDGVGNPPGKGYFFEPTLIRLDDAATATVVHEREVFGPVTTLIPFDGSAAQAASLVGRGGGSLVTSIYSDDRQFLADYLRKGGATSGRLYLASAKVVPQLPGPGTAMPHLLHGGPGRAGGGAELGGMRGLELYLQRVAVSGDRAIVERLAAVRGA